MAKLEKGKTYYCTIDFDGTLFFANKISYENKKYIKKARKAGMKFILNTGRSRGNIPPCAFEKIEWDYLLCGAGYIENKNGEILYSQSIDEKSLRNAMRVCKNIGSSVSFEGEKTQVGFDKDAFSKLNEKEFAKVVDDFIKMVKDNPITKISFWKPMDERVDARLPEFKIIHHPNYFEAFRKDSDKGTLLDILMEKENIKLDQLIAFGDSINDLDMFSRCKGYRVSMMLAPSELKDISDEVTKRSTTGVGDTLKKIIKEIK